MTSLLQRYEFHRHGLGALPTRGNDGSAIFIAKLPGSSLPLRSCTCSQSKSSTCVHLKDLQRGVAAFQKQYRTKNWEKVFATTVWYQVAKLLFDGNPQPCKTIEIGRLGTRAEKPSESSTGQVLRVTTSNGEELARYLEPSVARGRFLERCGQLPGEPGRVDRAALLERLALFQATPEERQLRQAGMQAQRQAWEESFWFRLAYHVVREHGTATGTFHPTIEQLSGEFSFTYCDAKEKPVVRFVVPRTRVQSMLRLLAEAYPEQSDLALLPIPLKAIFLITEDTELDVEARPIIRSLQHGGLKRFMLRPDLRKFRYGNLVYIKTLGILAELERPGQERKFRTPASMKLRRAQVESFRDPFADQLAQANPEAAVHTTRELPIFRDYDYLEITPETLERSWYWLSVDYGIGDQSIPLAHILRAKAAGLPYLETEQGWIDLDAPAFRDLDSLVSRSTSKKGGKAEPLRFSPSQLLRLQATAGGEIRIRGDAQRTKMTKRLLGLEPPEPFKHPEGLSSELRSYQQIGVDWLRFLYENHLSGLLCDDMGLGKTHQAMALMTILKEQQGVTDPFLVICPTSVISHWRNKIRDHAPGLKAAVYHGPERDLECYLEHNVLITSYGILRNDIEELSQLPFSLAILDEIQHIKNSGTLAYQAARELMPRVKIGMTGTPIENSLEELRALFDLLLPGYLGSAAQFNARYCPNGSDDLAYSPQGLRDLQKITSPFILRRLKSTVLDELPEKFDDVRTCSLSDDQVKLYRDAINTRATDLVSRLRQEQQPLPYIHIFALLNYLKQICDHPALALHQLDAVDAYTSGKWDLYREILQECLDSGQKVVVFTQYLGMIELMERHLKQLKVGYSKLTGATIARGEVIDRFNEEPSCRVFLGSLKAGGTGIDLVGGSVVIHYDRWWNAAREDQATDRVHRYGQKRAVQVFKLVTEGTLEEKIASIIDRKRKLMESVVQEDDPKLAKIFSRAELIEMLGEPADEMAVGVGGEQISFEHE